MRLFLFVVALLLSLPVWAAKDADTWVGVARQKALHKDPQWRRLLHYRRGVLGGEKSGVDDKAFFLSPRGRTHSDEELEATLRAVLNPLPTGPDNEPAACQFPARAAWLREQLGAPIPSPACSRYETWRERMNAGSLTLVFACYYMNNPASMYGHTFLRVNAPRTTREGSLRDYTINYAAATDTNSGLMFAVKGLAGGYRGRFATNPYYMQIQKYNNVEARDLWEYDLALSSVQVDRLMAHAWELGRVSMAYYFFNRNCSYQLLPLIETVDPAFELSRPFAFRAIPLDTLRAVINQRGLVSHVRVRPSHIRSMLALRSTLSADEIEAAEELVLSRGPRLDAAFAHSATLKTERRAAVLDAAYAYHRYRTGFQWSRSEEAKAREDRLLTARSEAAVPSASVDVPPVPAPEVAHGTGRVSFTVGATRESGFEQVAVRAALHDLEQGEHGFTPGSQLEMMGVSARYDNRSGKAWLDRFVLINIKSLAPWDRWVHPPSWRLNTGLETAKDLDRPLQDTIHYRLDGGSGLTLPFAGTKGMAYAMLEAEGGVGGVFSDGYRAGGGGSAGVLWAPMATARLHVLASWTRFAMGDISNLNRLRVVQAVDGFAKTEWRLGFERQNRYREVSLSVGRTF